MVIKRVLLFAFAIILFLALCGAATAASDFNIETAVGGESDSDWSFDGTVLTIGDGADIIITGAVDNGRCIVVESNAEVNITLDNVTIDTRNFSTSPFLLNTGADVALILKGDNFLYAGDNQAGIQTTGAALKIDGAGSLTANGGWYSAGIGGNNGNDGGTVEINGGVVKAADGWYGSIGIGGGTGSLDDGT
ncbi:MAG: carbohydrate-binding domain-containing protein, partial [Methanimicrococcus sp.]|nr:carbohydrate-binding domain-containing protein [Methanimicrococcus sp.]